METSFIQTNKREYRSYNEAKKYLKEIGITKLKQYKMFLRGNLDEFPSPPKDLPLNPQSTYSRIGGWINSEDFFNRKKLSYQDAQKTVSKRGFKNSHDFKSWIKNEGILNIPLCPDYTYKNSGWKNWKVFLGLD